QAILYAEPIYLQAQRSPMPELRLVVLALQDRLAYGPTFDAALTSLFGSEAASIAQSESPQPGAPAVSGGPASTSTAAQPAADTKALITRAGSDFADYQRLTSEGKLSEAGQKLDDLKHTLDELNARGK
ncbi:MAG: UPF0182 family protein, partial [Terracidiphilus sp.]